MANLAYLNPVCRNNHPPRQMQFNGYDMTGNAKYRCPWCSIIRRYRLIFGQVRRVA